MKQTAIEWLINEIHKKERGLIETSYNHLFDQAKEMDKEQKGFSEDDVNLAFFLGKKDDHVRLHKLINSRLGQLKQQEQ